MAGQGQLMALLWSPSVKVGRSGLTVDALVRRAVALADAEGLAQLTMRRLADEVGVGTMTLYRYVPGRAELVALMLDKVAAGVYDDRSVPRTKRSLRRAIEHIADRNWDHLLAHRWVVEVPPGRPIVGPGEVTKYEEELAPFDGRGLSDPEMDAALGALLALVSASARWHIGMDDARRQTELSDDQWWAATAPALGRFLSDDAFPLAGRVGSAVASAGEPRTVMQFGVAALVESVTSRLHAAGSRPA